MTTFASAGAAVKLMVASVATTAAASNIRFIMLVLLADDMSAAAL